MATLEIGAFNDQVLLPQQTPELKINTTEFITLRITIERYFSRLRFSPEVKREKASPGKRKAFAARIFSLLFFASRILLLIFGEESFASN